MTQQIGRPTNRIDGPLKVTGQARYTADIAVEGVLHGALVTSTIPSGRIVSVDARAVQKLPGVLHVLTHLNMPRLHSLESPPAGDAVLPLQNSVILYEGQPVALVIASTLPQARDAARELSVSYERTDFRTNLHTNLHRAESRPLYGQPPGTAVGNADAALVDAEVTLDHTYQTADRHHVPMETSSTLAIWRDARLLLRDAVQGVTITQQALARVLNLDPSQVDVQCDFVGGGFGCKGFIWSHQMLAAVAARMLRSPVRITLTRAQTFTLHGYQPGSYQRVRLGARRDGTLTAIRHDSVLAGSVAGPHVEPAGWGTGSIYACQDVSVSHRVVLLNKGNPTPMRAPIEGLGQVAVEIAMDELAWRLGFNPLELRLKNYTDIDIAQGRPFSAKKLRECYAEGARRFGWPTHMPAPGTLEQGRERFGYGMATALFQTFRSTARARVTANESGRVLVETGTQEIGGGTYTVLAQVAAEVLHVPLSKVDVVIGHTRLPEGPMSAGSRVTLSAGSAVQAAAMNLRRRFAELGQRPDQTYESVLRGLGVQQLAAEGEWSPARESTHSLYSFGAVFVQVAVDCDLCIPRVRRVVGIYDAGRIVNPKAALSQMSGGIVWGIGQALLERSGMDHQHGRFLEKNLAGYRVPVNADVPEIDVSFIDNFDDRAGPLGARGIGELGSIGIGAAIANAVFHATGRRLRALPILPEALLDAAG